MTTASHLRPITSSAALCAALASGALAQEASFTLGAATTINPGLIDCGSGSRVSEVGEIASEDRQVWTVPAATQFETGPKAPDLYNDCGGTEHSRLSDLDLASIPVADAGGTEEFVAYVFADNYFELYVNGTLIAVEPVPFTPFNSNVIRFSATRPVTLAIMGVDWEENLGLGSEKGRGADYTPGDAGVVLHVQDASGQTVALSDQSWKAQTFYTSPLADPTCLKVDGASRDSSACSSDPAEDGAGFSAAHWPLPEGWTQPDYDDSAWPNALTYSNDTVGVDEKPGFTNFPEVFDTEGADAAFIWSSNLVLDNLVLLRKMID
ncbi:hypothetical protein [Tabrizicola sp.]|uniref:hypothetical protein n=1 Tax=Tabrizicola sp. TaxID=2005166 RepID=UPI003F3E084A